MIVIIIIVLFDIITGNDAISPPHATIKTSRTAFFRRIHALNTNRLHLRETRFPQQIGNPLSSLQLSDSSSRFVNFEKVAGSHCILVVQLEGYDGIGAGI